jgi:hypothetical protein
MKHVHFIEIGDEPWCPRGIRRGVTDFCRFVTEVSGCYNPVAPLLADAIKKTGTHRILDMGSGAGGPWLGLLRKLRPIDGQRFSCDLRSGTSILSVHAGLVQPKIRFRKK